MHRASRHGATTGGSGSSSARTARRPARAARARLDDEARELARELKERRLAVSARRRHLFVYADVARSSSGAKRVDRSASSPSSASHASRVADRALARRRGALGRRAGRRDRGGGAARRGLRALGGPDPAAADHAAARELADRARGGGLRRRAPLALPDRRLRHARSRPTRSRPASTARSSQAASSSGRPCPATPSPSSAASAAPERPI